MSFKIIDLLGFTNKPILIFSAVSTRMVAGMWWFFVLIIIASYTANLAAFLSTENAIELFTNVQSLVENSEKHHIKFGALDGGSTATFFKVI